VFVLYQGRGVLDGSGSTVGVAGATVGAGDVAVAVGGGEVRVGVGVFVGMI